MIKDWKKKLRLARDKLKIKSLPWEKKSGSPYLSYRRKERSVVKQYKLFTSGLRVHHPPPTSETIHMACFRLKKMGSVLQYWDNYWRIKHKRLHTQQYSVMYPKPGVQYSNYSRDTTTLAVALHAGEQGIYARWKKIVNKRNKCTLPRKKSFQVFQLSSTCTHTHKLHTISLEGKVWSIKVSRGW